MEERNKKVIPPIKVKDMPLFLNAIIPKSVKDEWYITCSTGRVNSYRMAFAQGRGGSTKDHTWDKVVHKHSCCKSAVAWRHRAGCLIGDLRVAPDDLSDIKI